MRRFLPIAALAVLVSTAPARADTAPTPTNQAAQRHFESGVNFYKTGDYESARIEFEAGYRLSKLPDFLVNLCQVADKQNRIQEAINYCEQYLLAEPRAKDGDEVRARLARLNQQQAGAHVPPSPGVQPPATVPQARSTDTTASRSRPPAPALALLIGGGTALAAAVGSGVAALATAKQIESGPQFDDLAGLQRQGAALNTAAITLYVIGGAAAVAGGGWLAYWGTRRTASRTP